LGAADWARREAGRAARSSAEADERESRIAGLSKVVSVGALEYAINQAGVGVTSYQGGRSRRRSVLPRRLAWKSGERLPRGAMSPQPKELAEWLSNPA
jgi:hypothetical protein